MQHADDTPADRPRLAMPPRPAKPLSSIGVLRAAAKNSLSFCDDELFEKLVVPRRYGLQRVVFVSDPAGVRQVLLDRVENFPRWASSRRLFERELRTGTLSSEGETWRRHRRVATPVIDVRAIAPEVDALIAIGERRAKELERLAKREKAFDLQAWLGGFSTEMWNHVVSGGDPKGLEVIGWFAKVPHRPRVRDLVPKPQWLADLMNRDGIPGAEGPDRTLRGLIEDRKRPDYAGQRDLIWRLANAVDRQTGDPLPAEEARDETATLITGGVATVRAMTWIWYLLALHPEIEARVHAEISEAFGDGPPRGDALPALIYLRRTLDETMRLYPPIPAVMRQAAADDEICGVRVPRRAMVVVMPWLIHRHRRLWDDPDRFDPDRFFPEAAAARPRLAYIPFSTGPRICVAASFAITQLLVATSVLARRFRFRLAPGRDVTPTGAISLRAEGGLWVTVERR